MNEPRLKAPDYVHEWRVEIHPVSGKIGIGPDDGRNYLMIGLGAPLPWSWCPGWTRYTGSKRRAERLKASCQRWCDKQNVKDRVAKERADALMKEIQ